MINSSPVDGKKSCIAVSCWRLTPKEQSPSW